MLTPSSMNMTRITSKTVALDEPLMYPMLNGKVLGHDKKVATVGISFVEHLGMACFETSGGALNKRTNDLFLMASWMSETQGPGTYQSMCDQGGGRAQLI